MLNRCEHGIAYSRIEEINTAHCLQKWPLLENIQAYVNTTFMVANLAGLEEALSGVGTSHRVNSIAVDTALMEWLKACICGLNTRYL